VFCHVVAALQREAANLRGQLLFLFDGEEHTGAFVGIRRFIAEQRHPRDIDGVLIGYPGHEAIMTGCRGFLRATIHVRGQGAHSGSSRARGVNAATRAARLVCRLEQLVLDRAPDARFPLPPKLTVTGLRGGGEYSAVPDSCDVDVDVRLTLRFREANAKTLLKRALRDFDRAGSTTLPSSITVHPGGWPAYQLPRGSALYQALRAASSARLGRDLPAKVAGPSSVGNYLATLGIEATSGFGCNYRNLHAPDECIEIATLEPTYDIYASAIRALLK
jgi:succinyl-diaminopimelate desuccinylase